MTEPLRSMAASPWPVFVFLLCMCQQPVAETKRILLLPYPATSHARQLVTIGEELINNGHEVYVSFADNFPGLKLFENGQVKILTHSTTERDFYHLTVEEMEAIMTEMFETADIIKMWRRNHPEFENVVKNQLIDDEHYASLKALKFDLTIVDIFAMSRALLVIPYSLGVPYIGVQTMQEPWLSRNPTLPSFAPFNVYPGSYTPVMNFWQRLNNLWNTIDWTAWPRVNYLEDQFFQKYIRDNRRIATANELTGQCMLILIDSDPLLDYPRPMMPHEIQIAGLTIKPQQEDLSNEFTNFMDSSVNGVIIMSFGSLGFNLDERVVKQFVEAFHKIPFNILWKYGEVPPGLPSNVKIAKWLPQSDLLGHPNTKLFITHCGNNGQMEALYHAVPMIGYPIFGDQMYNCQRLPYHGFGVCLDSLSFKSSDLINAMNTIIANSSYKENIKRASTILKDRPMNAKETALYWVEHVMKYGGTHLRSRALDLAWYQYLMLDIAAFIICTMLSAIYIISLVIYQLIKPKGVTSYRCSN